MQTKRNSSVRPPSKRLDMNKEIEKPVNHLEVMKDARKKRRTKKRDLSDAMVVKSVVVMPPYRTENIIPEPHLTTKREFDSNAADSKEAKKLRTRNQLVNSRVSKLSLHNLSRLDDHDLV